MIPLALSLIAGILVGEKWPGGQLFFIVAAILCGLAIGINLIRSRASAFLPPVLFLCLGYLAIQAWTGHHLPENHIANLADNSRKVFLTGTIQTQPFQKNNRLRFFLKAEATLQGKKKDTVVGSLRVTVSGQPPKLQTGDRIMLRGRIRKIRNFNNPGGFDYERHMIFQGIRSRIYTRAADVQVLARHQIGPISLAVETVREKISRLLDETLSGKPLQILQTLILGNRHRISEELRESFNRAGASHILAISGLHIGIIASASFLLFSTIFSRFPFLLWKARVRKTAAVLSIFPILFYGIIAGMSPSTQRALIMVTIFLLTFPLEKEHDLINTIFMAALFIVIFFPPALFSISFQLSFAAVLSIVYGLSLIPASRPKTVQIRMSWIRKIYLFMMVSVFATLGTAPIVLHYFNQVSLIGVFTNLMAIPVIGFLVLPLGFMAVLLLPFSAGLSKFFLSGCEILLSAAIRMIQYLSDIPFAAIQTVTPSVFELLCIYVLLIGIPYRLGQKAKPAKPGIPFQNAIVTWIVGLTALALMLDIGYWIHTRFFHEDLRIHIMDVGQGNAAVLELPDGYTLMIDGGGFSSNQIFDVGSKIIAPFLWRKKIRTVDTLVLTHPNSDHMNGLIYIARHFHVKNFWSNQDPSQTHSFRELQKTIAEKGISHPLFHQLSTRHEINGVRFQILHPGSGHTGSKPFSTDPNENSLVIKVSYQGKSILFPGDIMKKAEAAVVKSHGDRLQSTILLAPHHGSRTSSSPSFLRKVDPSYVVISNGWKNQFRMPHAKTLSRYKNLGCTVLRTDQEGCITLRIVEGNLAIQTQ